MRKFISSAIAALALSAQSASADQLFCVASTAELTAALASLSNSPDNESSDEIRIRIGTYLAPVGGWTGSVVNTHDLVIRGGYTDADCLQQTFDAALTVLDGGTATGILTINTVGGSPSDIEVSGLTFQNGRSEPQFGAAVGGLKISDTGPISNGNFLIERNIFRNNVAIGGTGDPAGGLLAATDGASFIVRGNLFVNNSAPDNAAAFFYSNNAIDVSNNTFSGNDPTDVALLERAVMGVFTLSATRLSNNIFWGNAVGGGAYDLIVGGRFTHASLRNNDIEAIAGAADSDTGSLHVDPQFTSPTDFQLSPRSALIDAGVNNPDGGFPSVDILGAPRVDGLAVDLGAYESSYIFANGYD